MARSRKKSSTGAASSAKAAAEKATDETASEDTAEDQDAADSPDPDSATEPADETSGARPSGKDPATAKGRRAKRPGSSTAPAGGEVSEKAKDSTRASSVKRTAAAETSRSTGRRVAAAGQNPPWLAPTAVVFLILGLLYLVTYYLSSGQLPLPIGDWNLAVGFGVLMVGGGMLMFWK